MVVLCAACLTLLPIQINLWNGTVWIALALGQYGGIFGGFIAGMFYLRWLAPRAPNQRVRARAGVLMWCGVVHAILLVLFVADLNGPGSPGAALLMLILFFAPLILLMMYYNMFEWLRKDLEKTCAEQIAKPAR